MNFDERMAALTGRHEALTQSVELLLLESRKHDEQIAKNAEQIAKNAEQITKNSTQIDRLTTIAGQTLEMIQGLANTAQAHEIRIERLEESQ